MSEVNSTAIEVTRNRIKYHFVNDKTHNNQNQEYTSNCIASSASEQNGCHRKTWGCQPCVISNSYKPQFNVAANGHDYLSGGSCCEVNNNIKHVKTVLSSQNMVPHSLNTDIGNNGKSIDKETENNEAKELFLLNSSGLVLKKEKKSWTVKLKTSCTPSIDSCNSSCLKIGNETGELSTKGLEKTRDHVTDKGYSEENTKMTSSSSSALSSSCPMSDNNYCNHIADTGKLCKIKIKHMHRNGSISMTTPHQERHRNGVKAKKNKKLDTLKHSPSVYGTSACRKSAAANGEHQRVIRRNLLAEGREGEAVAVKALAAANDFSKSSESVRNAEREIARALEIIQLQLRVLQDQKKQKSKKSDKLSQKSSTKLKSTTKKCNLWEPDHTVDLADVFPLPPSLIVKDGDLHPACSMRIEPDCQPGPNHPIWRWRLGQKPLPRPPKRRLSQASIENGSEGTSR